MGFPILSTKLIIPPLQAKIIHRKRLLERMSEGITRKLTLLSAPAGYGKTTLLSEWAALCAVEDYPVLWLSLDPFDNNPHQFWTCFLRSIKEFLDNYGEVAIPEDGLLETFCEEAIVSLINTIFSGTRRDFAFILDDYHQITLPSIHAGIDFLIGNLPEQMHLVIATRQDPPLSMAQLRARDQLVELRTEDLRFNQEEETDFFLMAAGLSLSGEELEIMDQHIEGWPAALQLAALSIKDSDDPLAFVKNFGSSHRYIVDYLGEQVLSLQEEAVKGFLLETSILTRLSAGLCESVSKGCEGQQALEQLERLNLFLMPLDDQRSWYRYHPLFAGFLKQRLFNLFPEQITVLHCRASRWYEDNGMLEEAIQHALDGKDFEHASQLIEKMLNILRSQGQWRTLLGWIKCIPEELIQTRLPLCIAYASSLIVNGQVDMAETFLTNAEKPYLQGTPGFTRLYALARNLRGLSAGMRGQNYAAIEMSQEAYDLFPPDELRARGLSMLISGCCYFMLADFETAERYLIKAGAYLQESAHTSAFIRAVHYLGRLKAQQGRLYEASRIYQRAIQILSEERDEVLTGIELIDLGELHREWNNLEEAVRLNQAGLHQVEASGDYVFVRDGYIARAKLEMALGKVDEALYYIYKADYMAGENKLQVDRSYIRAHRTRIWLAAGRLSEAECWLENCATPGGTPNGLIDEYIQITCCRVLESLGRNEEALCLARKLFGCAESGGRWGRAIEIQLLIALALHSRGELKEAQETLKHALLLAEPEGFVRVFIDLGCKLKPILIQVGKSKFDAVAGYAVKMLHLLERQKTPSTPLLKDSSSELLSKRERQILEMIAAGLSYQEIANELVIALSTVQTHIRNMYVKLDVHSGIEAVNCARKLSLIT